MKRLIKSHKIVRQMTIIMSFFLLSLIYISVSIKNGYIMVGSDRMFHLERMEEAYQTLKNGHIISYISTYSFARIGQAINIFYPSLNLVFYAFIHIFVKNEIYTFYLFMFLEQFIGLIISFYSGKIILKNVKAAYLFAITLRFSSYILYNDFARCDIGESWALLFVPMVLAGLYMIMKYNSAEGKLILAIGLILELSCHILTTLITIVFVVGCYIVYFLFESKNLQKFYSLVISGILFILGSLFITVPIINTMLVTKINKPDINVFNSYNLSMSTLLSNSLNNELSLDTPNIGLVLVIVLTIGFVFLKRENKLMNYLYFSSLFLIIMVTNLFPWNLFSKTPLTIIQFPWRLLIIIVILLSLYFAGLAIERNFSLKSIILILILILSITLGAQYRFINEQNSDYKTAQNYKNIQNGWGVLLDKDSIKETKSKNMINSFSSRSLDYFPESSVSQNNDIFEHKVSINSDKRTLKNNQIVSDYQSITYKLHTSSKNQSISLPFLIYNKNNYRLYQNGKKVNFKVTQSSIVSVKKPKGIKNVQYKIKFNTPILWKVANYISLFTFIFLISMLVYLIRGKRTAS
ncbi:hypothetical protein LMB58_08290 [Limosilactobacillus reuteri]|uniref:hypothetical protein n=1 Tax=Limosilactobacillus reuteri TaxID=1598 RepID=UPI001E333F45|nr:hypothetical protein [Limosilactobacillus reuteri]MCC4328510.1 hypothetical protein [Limosilactobacillus reuteri]MCC4336635.1 hypothetical protein [Limosilactobacillus reuteri]MCC4338550.1 hypothetical protein [Limosilactobacillus reuteri]